MASDQDALALGHVCGFTYPVLARVFVHCILQQFGLSGQYESARPEIEMMLAVLVLHAMDPVGEEILARQLDAARKMIDFLEFAHPLIKDVFQGLSCPHYNPVFFGGARLIR